MFEILQNAACVLCVCVYTRMPEMFRNDRKVMKPLKYLPTEDEEEGGGEEVLASRNVMKPMKH